MSRIGNYLRDTRAELDHVSWPTRQQALIYTALVLGISIVVALFTSGFDYVFSTVLNFAIDRI